MPSASTEPRGSAPVTGLVPVGVLVPDATGPQPVRPALDPTWQDHLDQLTFITRERIAVNGGHVSGQARR